MTFAYSHNKIEVTGQKLINGVQPVSDSLVEDIENNYPNDRFVLTGNAHIGERFNVLARVNWYGAHYDERGTIAGSPDAADPAFTTGKSFEIGATTYVDLELGYQVNDNWRVVLGAVNAFDEFIDTIGNAPPAGCPTCSAEFANRIGVGLQYPRRTVANYEGGSWYLRASYGW